MKENAVAQAQEQKKPRMGFKGRLALLMTMLTAMMSLGAFAAEGEGTASTGGDFSAVMGSMSTLSSLMTQVWNMMTSNPLLVLFLAVALLSVGVGVFRMIKRAARH